MPANIYSLSRFREGDLVLSHLWGYLVLGWGISFYQLFKPFPMHLLHIANIRGHSHVNM